MKSQFVAVEKGAAHLRPLRETPFAKGDGTWHSRSSATASRTATICRRILFCRPISVSAAPAATRRRISRGRTRRRKTKSFAVTCYDPDAPTGSGFWHWLAVNISANVSELAEGAGSAGGKLPAGALQTRTDFGAPGYGGPCPPAGDHPHRYLFTVFAVKADRLAVKADTSAAVVGFNLHFNTLAKAEIMGLFKR
jgi:Raf kinase inhibitor-like YbhB/YbcL family protein